MNYHKKILSIGFKRHKEVIVIASNRNSWLTKIDGDKIMTLEDYRKEVNYLPIIYQMNLTIYETDRPITYYWKINQSVTIYITINKFDFCSFIDDKDSPDLIYPPIVEKTNIKIICTGRLTDQFWKTIISNLPINIKREVLLKQIL